MTAEEALLLIDNLDYEAEYRDTAPRWSTVVVNERGTIVGVIRHDSEPSEELGRKHLMMYPGTVQFEAWPGKYGSKDDLAREVEKARRAVEPHNNDRR
ncbi:MAG: hypothetical protein EG825_13650 [Rhodocyclaceae bacterium]|nr:hypothetical protein [Rhodocyclaceae bacterium]